MKKEDCRFKDSRVLNTGKEVSNNDSTILLCQYIFEFMSSAAKLPPKQGEPDS